MTDEGAAPGSNNGQSNEALQKGRRSRVVWSWVFLASIAAVAGMQIAGVLLRDRVEGRKPLLAEAPALRPEPAQVPPPPEGGPARFGPDVREVIVAPSPPDTTAGEQPEGRSPPAKSVAASPLPTHALERPTSQGAAPPRPSTKDSGTEARRAGTHVLELDTFFSQSYLREAQEQLQSHGLPFFLREAIRRGKGHRLAVTAADPAIRDKARQVLQAKGYLYRETREGLELFFFFPDEARTAAATVLQEGASSSSSVTDGERPVWKLYAGPFSFEDAKAAQRRLEAEGIKTLLRKHR